MTEPFKLILLKSLFVCFNALFSGTIYSSELKSSKKNPRHLSILLRRLSVRYVKTKFHTGQSRWQQLVLKKELTFKQILLYQHYVCSYLIHFILIILKVSNKHLPEVFDYCYLLPSCYVVFLKKYHYTANC